MEQLIKVTTVPFHAIRFTQNARLVPADNMALERHKALVRHHAFQTRFRAATSSVDYDFLNQVNVAFSKNTKASQTPAPSAGLAGSSRPAAGGKAGDGNTVTQASSGNQAFHPSPAVIPSGDPSLPASAMAAMSGDTDRQVHTSSAQVAAEAAVAYAVQRGSFELRVAKGELSYVPPLVMTIVTQYPDIQFEYTGGFNYIPPREDSPGTNMNLSI